MATSKYIDSDIVKVYKYGESRTPKNLLATLFWGDKVDVVKKVNKVWKLEFTQREWDDNNRRYVWKKYDAAISSKVSGKSNFKSSFC